MNKYDRFKAECAINSKRQANDKELMETVAHFKKQSFMHKYSYNFEFMGRPIIQYPQDIVAIQELIWTVKPDLIVETGIAHGGSLIMSASMLGLLDLADAEASRKNIDAHVRDRKVIGIDVDIRKHNREAIEAHPMGSRIHMIEGSSISPEIVSQVRNIASGYANIMVFLDSNHTHDHVLAELEAYAGMVTVGSYCVVFDTVIEELDDAVLFDRPWSQVNNPKTAVREFLKNNSEFVVDETIENKLLITVAAGGYLKKLT